MNNHPISDLFTWIFAAVAVVSLAKAALIVSVVAGLISIALGLIRLHDRIKYGPKP